MTQPYALDFQEIAHCGGQATVNVRVDSDGKRAVAIGVRQSRPNPARWIGIYALAPHGIPVGDFRIGGMGQPFDPPPPLHCWPVFLGSDLHGHFGHQCPRCNGDFRNSSHSAAYPLCCPYCRLRASAFQFLTPAQKRYTQHFIRTILQASEIDLEPNSEKELVIDMDAVIDQARGAERPSFYYAAETQQTRFTCEKCGEFNDIRGLYCYCAACATRNNLSLEPLANRLTNSVG